VEKYLKSDNDSYTKYKKFLLKEVVDTSYNVREELMGLALIFLVIMVPCS